MRQPHSSNEIFKIIVLLPSSNSQLMSSIFSLEINCSKNTIVCVSVRVGEPGFIAYHLLIFSSSIRPEIEVPKKLTSLCYDNSPSPFLLAIKDFYRLYRDGKNSRAIFPYFYWYRNPWLYQSSVWLATKTRFKDSCAAFDGVIEAKER